MTYLPLLVHSAIKGMHPLWLGQNIATCWCYARPFSDNLQWSSQFGKRLLTSMECDWSSHLQIKGLPDLFPYHTCDPPSSFGISPLLILVTTIWSEMEAQNGPMSFMVQWEFELGSPCFATHIWSPNPDLKVQEWNLKHVYSWHRITALQMRQVMDDKA